MNNKPANNGLGPAEGEISPLAEASPTSLEDLFNKDPLSLTKQDRLQTILYLQRARDTFLKEDAAKVPKAKAAKAPAAPKKAMDSQLTLDDLDLDL